MYFLSRFVNKLKIRISYKYTTENFYYFFKRFKCGNLMTKYHMVPF